MSVKPPQFGPTQKDIARALDLSQACVAIALNPKSRNRLPSATVAMIEAKARELKYRPQRQARILRSGRSHTIGVVGLMGALGYHAPQERIRHLARSAIHAGYQMISLDMDWFEGNDAAAQDYLQSVAVEGIIFCNIGLDKQAGWRDFVGERSLPVVSMSSSFDDLDQVQADMRKAFRDMTRHHLEQGSRNLHLLLPSHDPLPAGAYSTIVEKVDGFIDAIRASGGEVVAEPGVGHLFDLPEKPSAREASIVGCVHYPLRSDLHKEVFDAGYIEAKRLLQNEGTSPDSLICSNDHIAAGALAACEELQIPIPDAVRLSGADNAPFSRYFNNSLTTIEQPSQQMADWSMRRLVELIENPEERIQPKKEIFPCELVFRKST